MNTLSVTVFAMMWINAVEMRSFGVIEIMAKYVLDDQAMMANRGLIGKCINPIGKQVEKAMSSKYIKIVDPRSRSKSIRLLRPCFLPPVFSEARVKFRF